MTLESSVTLAATVDILYLHMMVHGEALHQFDMLSAEVGSTTSQNSKNIILGLGTYFPPVNALSKRKCAMCRGMKNPRGFKVRFYAACIIDLNKYFSVLPGAKESDECFETEFNDIVLNSMPNIWTRQAYVQGFYFETNTLKTCKYV